MRPTEGDSEDEPNMDDVVYDLMCGIGPWHIQSLCVNDMGMGYTPQQVGEMTLDNIFMLLSDKKVLRKSVKRRSVKGAVPQIEKDGTVRGRAEDGTEIRGRIAGKSLARQLMEAENQVKESTWKIRSRKRAERRDRRKKK